MNPILIYLSVVFILYFIYLFIWHWNYTAESMSSFATVMPNIDSRKIVECDENTRIFNDAELTNEEVTRCLAPKINNAKDVCKSALYYADKYGDTANIDTIKDANDFVSGNLSGKNYNFIDTNVKETSNLCYTFYTDYQKWDSELDKLTNKPCGKEPTIALLGDKDLTEVQKTYATATLSRLDEMINKLTSILDTADVKLNYGNIDSTKYGTLPIFKILGPPHNQSINLILPKGERGEQGPPGNPGATGLDGYKGDNGERGDTGKWAIPNIYKP